MLKTTKLGFVTTKPPICICLSALFLQGQKSKGIQLNGKKDRIFNSCLPREPRFAALIYISYNVRHLNPGSSIYVPSVKDSFM